MKQIGPSRWYDVGGARSFERAPGGVGDQVSHNRPRYRAIRLEQQRPPCRGVEIERAPPAPPPRVAIWRYGDGGESVAQRKKPSAPPRAGEGRDVHVACPFACHGGRLSERRSIQPDDRRSQMAIPVFAMICAPPVRRRACLACLACLAACGPSRPDLASRISAEGRAAEFPELVPLAPLLRTSDALLPRSAARDGASLEARAADLRRRAALLRQMDL